MRAAAKTPVLTGKTILVTGATSGIGRAAAVKLSGAGATVFAHGRSPEKTDALAAAIGAVPVVADFARLDDVRRLAGDVLRRAGRLDAVLHNAGSFHARRTITGDGFEATFQTNYLAPFLLQSLLQGLVAGTAGSRIVVTSSIASHLGRVDLEDLQRSRSPYRGLSAYAYTKLLDVLFVAELRRRLAGTTTTAVAVHPGFVGSHFGSGTLLPSFFYRIPVKKRYLLGLFINTVDEGAEPLVWLATHADREDVDHPYFSRFRAVDGPAVAGDEALARELWRRTETLLEPWLG